MVNKTNMKFLKTDSLETRAELLALGFTEIETQDVGMYTFLNNGRMTFDTEKKNCVYTNIINL